MNTVKSIKFIDSIGYTPLVDLSNCCDPNSAKLYAKCEFLNPGYSMKDCIAQYILNQAEANKKLTKGDTIVCASSGNTGCSFAMLGSLKGYNVIVVTSQKCSLEKQNHIRSFNAQLMVVSEGHDYMEYAHQLACKHNYFKVDQYNNPNNPEIYYKTLDPEIWEQTNGRITHFVMTGSTFGCITGTAKFLKEQNHEIKVILADPLHSNIYEYYYHGYCQDKSDYIVNKNQPYIIEGAGKYKPTKCLDFSLIDEVIQVSDEQAISMCYKLLQTEGILVGGSSGLNIFASKCIAEQLDEESVVVTILCDSGIKYLSKIYNPEFLRESQIILG